MQYRTIRYKVITRIVGTNSLLEKMKIKNTDACEHCMERENIENKFWYCQKVQSFWNELKALFVSKRLNRLADKININEIILGGDNCLFINHIVSVGVYIIYSKKRLSLSLVLAILRSDFISEKYYAKLSDKIEEFNRKWLFINLLQEVE